MRVAQYCLKILGKLQKAMELWKILMVKLVSDYLSGNSRRVFGQFSENLKLKRKSWENDLRENNFSENCRQILGEYSEYFRFCH